MKKAVIISDSFKGTLTSAEIADIFEKSLNRFFPGCTLLKIPVADGGEGTVEVFGRLFRGRKITVHAKDPLLRDKKSSYLLTDDLTAFIETAESSGLTLLKEEERNPGLASTYGTGLEIKDAIARRAKKIVLGLGGSATNDAGLGCMAALGAVFKNAEGQSFLPTGLTLKDIASVDTSKLDQRVKGIDIVCMCDVDCPLYGPSGAAFTFAKQKGADEAMILELDENLRAFAARMKENGRPDFADEKGSGAAGGFGCGALSFLHAALKPGIDTILDLIHFDDLLDGCDCVFTGEGKFDSQSARGKVIAGILRHTQKKNIPVVVLCGGAEEDTESLIFENSGIRAVMTTNRLPMDFSSVVPYSRSFYESTVNNVLALIRLGESFRT